MEEVIYIEGIKEAAPVGWNGSYADEGEKSELVATYYGSALSHKPFCL